MQSDERAVVLNSVKTLDIAAQDFALDGRRVSTHYLLELGHLPIAKPIPLLAPVTIATFEYPVMLAMVSCTYFLWCFWKLVLTNNF